MSQVEWLIYIWLMSLICRDIKLQNILLDRDGHCKLCDFGSCKLGIFYGKKKTGTIVGTIPFIAPEVIITVHFTCDSCIFVE
jgi:serine/threonine protein kinase